MFEFLVCDWDFRPIGRVKAWSLEDALAKAKIRFPLAIAPMVWR